LTPSEAVDYLVAVQRTQSMLAELEYRALAVAAGAHETAARSTVPTGDDEPVRIEIIDGIRDEIAAALHQSCGFVSGNIGYARLLNGPLRGVRGALRHGRISAAHARAVADEIARIDGIDVVLRQPAALDTPEQAARRAHAVEVCARIESAILPAAEAETVGVTRGRARRLVLALDSDEQERRRKKAAATVDVHFYPESDGLGVILARLPLAHAARVYAALQHQAEADRASDTPIELGRARADALIAAVCGDAAGTRVGVEIGVVVDADVLLGASDAPARLTAVPGGSGHLSAQAVRDLVADPCVPIHLRRLVTDPVSGELLDRGRTRYAVSDALRAYLAVRDRTCRFPGCQRRADLCQIDHAQAWQEGGSTDIANLGHLCTRHHQLKTHGGWQITRSTAGGGCTWRSPQGREYDVDPPPPI
jgi:hypothetical protein